MFGDLIIKICADLMERAESFVDMKAFLFSRYKITYRARAARINLKSIYNL